MNKLNWPTAFVITAIIFAGAFIYNKPTTAAFGSDGMIATSANGYNLWQLKDGKLRRCQQAAVTNHVKCGPWKD
jgi:hypothetical protein